MQEKPPRPPVPDRIFEILVETVRDYAVFVLDPEGRIATWNTGARLLKGYEADEVIGRHFSIFYLPDSIATGWPQQELKVAAMQGRFEDEGWRVRKDGSRFWANVIITALRDGDGQLLGFSKITRDLTARRAAEEALRQSEERFRLLIEGVQDYAVYMLDPDGMVTSWNSGAQKMIGYTREEVLGRHISLFYRAEDITAGRPWHELAEARRTGRAEDESWRLRKGGERFWARVVVTSLYDHDGTLRGFAKVTQDLSQREYARDLERTAQRLNEFIAMLAHELRNPLAPIRTAVHMMEKLPPGHPGQADMRRTVERQSAHLTRIVDDLLDVARVTRGTLSIEHAPVDLAEVAARALEIATAATGGAQHRLAVDVPPGNLIVSGDSARLAQIVGNLLTNAARLTPKGGSIWVKAWREGDEVVVTVRDSGRGIPPANLDSIFGMFVQGKEPIHRVGGGLGVGLALARRLAELHGGTLIAKSEGEGKGAEFILRVPIGSVQSAAAPSRPVAAAERGVAKRVLIVDDNIDAAVTLDGLMRSLGHATRVAHDGAQALAIADEFQPDVVLLDLGLPGISGYEVARALRERFTRPMKIIAVTGWGAETDRSLSAEAGFDLHLVKPVDESELLRILRNGVDNGGSTSIH